MVDNIKTDDEREKFERWWEIAQHNGKPPRLGWAHWREGDGYSSTEEDDSTQREWEAFQAGWQARAAQEDKK